MWITLSLVTGLLIPAILTIALDVSPPSALLDTPRGQVMLAVVFLISLVDLGVQILITKQGQPQTVLDPDAFVRNMGTLMHSLAMTPVVLSLALPLVVRRWSSAADLGYAGGPPVDWINLSLVVLSLYGHWKASHLLATLRARLTGEEPSA